MVLVAGICLYSGGPSAVASVLSPPADPPARTVAFHPQWLKLLHYRMTSGGWESEADSPEFFLSERGKRDPVAELAAALKAFRGESGPNSAPCRFPARLAFLSGHYSDLAARSPSRNCPRWHGFRESLRSPRVSLVFSSYFLNGPASAFGHLFLKFHTSGERKLDLLDSGVNFAATADTDNALKYAVLGLTGGFPGTFTRVPYYLKVREYEDFESRDLWEYELNLSQDAVDRLIAHLWELGQTHFDYFYLRENCAYHILALLETALPGTPLSEDLPAVVLPLDVLQRVATTPKLVREVRRRPSLRNRLTARWEALLPGEAREFRGLLAGRPEVPPGVSAAALDAALDFVDYRHFADLLSDPRGRPGRWKASLLRERARLPVPARPAAPSPETPPHLSHPSRRAQFAVTAGSVPALRIGFRFALHDPLDPPAGYPPGAHLEFLSLALDQPLTLSGAPRLAHLSLVRAGSSAPGTPWETPLSWEFDLGWQRSPSLPRPDCPGPSARVGAGLTASLAPLPLAVTALAETTQLVSSRIPGFSSYQPGAGLRVRLRSWRAEQWGLNLEGALRYLPLWNHRLAAEFAAEFRWHFSPRASATLGTGLDAAGPRGQAGMLLYF